jgi:hypothetical protein
MVGRTGRAEDQKTTYCHRDDHRHEGAPTKGTAPRECTSKSVPPNGLYEAVVSAAKLTFTRTGDQAITVDLCIRRAGKRFKLAATWGYWKFCQAAGIEEHGGMHSMFPKLWELASIASLSSSIRRTDTHTNQSAWQVTCLRCSTKIYSLMAH